MKKIDLDQMNLQQLDEAEMGQINGGGLLDGISGFLSGFSGNVTNFVYGALNSVSTLSVPGLIKNTGNLATGLLYGIANTFTNLFTF